MITTRAPARSPGERATRGNGGRRPSTTHARLGEIGIRLFTERGYDTTSIDDIAAAAGIARRTFFGYFPAKADIVWGDFDAYIDRFRAFLARADDSTPMMDAVRLAVLDFNAVPADELPQHRRRMALILGVPSLVAHSTLRYAQWREVLAEFAAARTGQRPGDLLPTTVGYCALGASVAAYEVWLQDDGTDLHELIDRAFADLAVGFRHDH